MARRERIDNWFQSVLSDCRFALRLLRKSPAFTIIAILTLAIGIGANSAVFSIVNAVMLRPLSFADSSHLVSVNAKTAMFPDMTMNLTWPAFQKVQQQLTSFNQSAVYWSQSKAFTGRGDPQLLDTTAVSADFFTLLGVHPRLGRLLAAADQDDRNGKVIVISESLWRARLAADPNIIGQSLTLDQQPYRVIGVAAKGFTFPDKTDAWTPVSLDPETKLNPTFFAFAFIGRRKPHVDMPRLNAELKPISGEMRKEFPQLKEGYELVANDLLEAQISDARVALLVLLGAATLVLLIACTNLATMLLARGRARHQEMAVRAALGAAPSRILRQMLVESCLLGTVGGCAAVALATLGVRVFRVVAPENTPRLAEIHPDWVMVTFALAVAFFTGILFGLAPARHAMRATLQRGLQEFAGARGVGPSIRQSRIGPLLVAGEVALAFVLLIGAGLMLQTLARLLHQDAGFRTDNLLTFDLHRPAVESDSERRKGVSAQTQQIKDIIQNIQSLPGVQSVGAANYGLLDGNVFVHSGLRVEGSATVDSGSSFAVSGRYVSPTYFKTLGVSFLRGRAFTDHDTQDTPQVAIVNEAMARKYWGTLDVLGKRFSTDRDLRGNVQWGEIVGVVKNAREFFIRDEPGPEYFLPIYHGGGRSCSLLVRTSRDPQAFATAVIHRIWSIYPDVPVTRITSVTATIADSIGDQKLHAVLLAIFAATGLLMALVGTYGVIAYTVERKTAEIGVRIALGATRVDVLLLVYKHGFVPLLLGVAIGIPVSLLAQRVLAAELYGVKPTDPFTFSMAALLMIAVAVLACYVPARRASRVDPIVALRYE